MKSFVTTLLLVAAFGVVAAPAFATCPTPPNGPIYFGSNIWYEYTPAQNCMTYSGGISTSTMWCYSIPSWSVTSTNSLGVTSYEFVPTVTGFTKWEVDVWMEFDDPNNSANNWVELWVSVTNGGVTTTAILMQWDGTDGDLSCTRRGGSFTAQPGDTIKLVTYMRKANSNATVQVSVPNIFSYQ